MIESIEDLKKEIEMLKAEFDLLKARINKYFPERNKKRGRPKRISKRDRTIRQKLINSFKLDKKAKS